MVGISTATSAGFPCASDDDDIDGGDDDDDDDDGEDDDVTARASCGGQCAIKLIIAARKCCRLSFVRWESPSLAASVLSSDESAMDWAAAENAIGSRISTCQPMASARARQTCAVCERSISSLI